MEGQQCFTAEETMTWVFVRLMKSTSSGGEIEGGIGWSRRTIACWGRVRKQRLYICKSVSSTCKQKCMTPKFPFLFYNSFFLRTLFFSTYENHREIWKCIVSFSLQHFYLEPMRTHCSKYPLFYNCNTSEFVFSVISLY